MRSAETQVNQCQDKSQFPEGLNFALNGSLICLFLSATAWMLWSQYTGNTHHTMVDALKGSIYGVWLITCFTGITEGALQCRES